MKGVAIAVALAVSATVAHADTVSTKVPDVSLATFYKCVKSDGSVQFSSSATPAEPGQVCSQSGTVLVPNASRPGLDGYRVIGADDKSAALMNVNSFRIRGNTREAWVMISYAQPQHYNARSYSRVVWKWTVDCAAHTSTAGAATFYAVTGSSVDLAGSMVPDPVPTEPVPNTVADAVVAGVCAYKPEV